MSYSEGPRYEARCNYGHVTSIYLEEQRFEILFEVGAHAILDEYFREAIASFTASLEQFYEFAIRCFVKRSAVELEAAGASWKEVANSSERQHGAFVYLWLTHFKSNPDVLSNKLREFRNDVIHKGVIPEKKRAIWYGDQLLSLVIPQLAVMMAEFEDEILEIKHETYQKFCDQLEPVLTIAGGTIVSTTNFKPDLTALEGELRRLEEYNEMMRVYVDGRETVASGQGIRQSEDADNG
jgi:hypothetical protein